jgi:arsenate reductase
MKITIYHNPRCTKSRAALQLLEQHGIEPRIVEYLKDPPDKKTLRDILARLGMTPRQLMRTKEKVYRDLALDRPGLSDEALIDAMVKNPILIERPIVLAGGKAVVGRPPERVLEITGGG